MSNATRRVKSTLVWGRPKAANTDVTSLTPQLPGSVFRGSLTRTAAAKDGVMVGLLLAFGSLKRALGETDAVMEQIIGWKINHCKSHSGKMNLPIRVQNRVDNYPPILHLEHW